MTTLLFDRHPVDPSRVAQFEMLAGELVVRMREASGLLWAECGRVLGDETSYLVVSEWRTETDAGGWTSSSAAADFAKAADVLRRADPTLRRFTSPGP